MTTAGARGAAQLILGDKQRDCHRGANGRGRAELSWMPLPSSHQLETHPIPKTVCECLGAPSKLWYQFSGLLAQACQSQTAVKAGGPTGVRVCV